MYAYFKRLVSAGAAYQVSDLFAKVVALGLLPLYTRYLTPVDYATAELLLTVIILVSIVVRLGIGEAFVRFYYLHEEPERRERIARAATGLLLLTTTALAAVAAGLSGPLSKLVLGYRDVPVWLIAVGGMWVFTNLELAYALLRVDERKRAYLRASLSNVAMTIAFTVTLVVGLRAGARGLLAGNFGASAVVLLALAWTERSRIGLRLDRGELPAMLRFGLPTVPADASVFALNFVDRLYLYHYESRAAAGWYALAVKLSTVVIFTVRGFQYAWPPLAYSVRDDDEARRLYAFVTTYFALFTGLVVAGIALLGRWVVRLFAAPEFFPAHRALPWVALGWALYGLFLVLVVIAGRARVTTRNFPAAAAGLAANVVLLVVLVPRFGIAGAGIALCGAYVVMLAVMHLLTRGLFRVPFEWLRLAHLVVVIGGATVAADLLLPDAGIAGFIERGAAFLAIPVLLVLTRFFRAEEIGRMRGLLRRARATRAPVERA